MNNLLARLLTAAVLVPVLIGIISWPNPLGLWLLILLVTVLGLREWMRMTQLESPLDRGFCIGVGTAVAAGFYWWGAEPLVFPVILAFALISTFLYFLFRFGQLETVAARMSHAVTGYLYVSLLSFLAVLKQRRPDDGAGWVYVVLTVAWLSDSGAYFAGRFLGPYWPRRLYERVSPKKTLVGALGGLLASVGAVALAKLWYLPTLAWRDCLWLAVPANLLGQCGDLAESLLKRSTGVKDSGGILPGHGGLLDRIDAVLFVAPYVFAYARWIHGSP